MPLRIGFLGAGLIADFHRRSLAKADGGDIELAAVYDVDPARAGAFAEASGARVASSEDEVIDGADAVYVCTWTSEHRRQVEAVAAAGRAVFCEKPLSVDLPGAEAMAAAVEAAGVVNQVGLIMRRSPAYNLLVHMMGRPESGRLIGLSFRDDQYLPTQGMYRSTWRGDPALAGAGVLMEHSIHDLDLIDWVGGGIRSVTARTAFVHGLDGVEDVAAVGLTLGDGAVGSLVTFWHDILERPSTRRCEVFCEKAMFVVENDWWGPLSWLRDGGGEGTLEGRPLTAALAEVMDVHPNPDGAFVQAVLQGGPASPDFRTAVRAHAVVDACYRSAGAGGAAVTL
ncbi:MAG TPA: Gfo/Idh/MocA family oxidoreductase [Acidimicrobiales bacterium]|nr:Gfo/Idh/MocA family oxidoreductase [Acidimicrobiales bacterium]